MALVSFKNPAVCSSVLPLDVEDTAKATLIIPFKTFEMAGVLSEFESNFKR